jgi:hypothetical protein
MLYLIAEYFYFCSSTHLCSPTVGVLLGSQNAFMDFMRSLSDCVACTLALDAST